MHSQGPPKPDTTVAYGTQSPYQIIDLFLPSTRNAPVVLFTYGGGWHSPRGPGLNAVCDAVRKAGIACLLASHRLGPADLFPAQAEDLAAAAAWVLGHAAALGVDRSRFFLAGHSSGAHLSALIALDTTYLTRAGVSARAIRGVVALSTPSDLRTRPSGDGYGDALMGGAGADTFRRDTTVLWQASPLRYVRAGAPPFLLAVAENDFPMLPGDSRVFADALKQRGVEVSLLVVPGGNHLSTVAALLDPESAVWKAFIGFVGR